MKIIIFDIDGTLSDNRHRLHLANKNNPVMWNDFLEKSIDDTTFDDVAELCYTLNNFYNIVFVTGRSDKYRLMTANWLDKHFLPHDGFNLFMRKDGDERSDEEVKYDIYKNEIEPYHEAIGIFEDNPECINMWRKLGLTCYDVGSLNK